MRVALTGLPWQKYFRDEEGQDVLFFVDNIFRFTQGIPRYRLSWAGCPPLWVISPKLADRDGSTSGADHLDREKGSVTSIQAILRAC